MMNSENSELQIITRSGMVYGKYNPKLHFGAKRPSYNYSKLIDEYKIKKELDTMELGGMPRPRPKLRPSIGFDKWNYALKYNWDNTQEYEVLVCIKRNYNPIGFFNTSNDSKPIMETKFILYHEPALGRKRGNYWCITSIDILGKIKYFIEPYYFHPL